MLVHSQTSMLQHFSLTVCCDWSALTIPDYKSCIAVINESGHYHVTYRYLWSVYTQDYDSVLEFLQHDLRIGKVNVFQFVSQLPLADIDQALVRRRRGTCCHEITRCVIPVYLLHDLDRHTSCHCHWQWHEAHSRTSAMLCVQTSSTTAAHRHPATSSWGGTA